MDVTTLALAVDSTQVNTASTALQKMAAEGFKAETVVAKLANTAQVQGRALNSGIVKNAAAAADSIKGLTGATSALASAQDFSRTTSGLAAAATQANAATGAVRAFGAAVAATAAAGMDFSAPPAPRATTVQQIAQAPVSVAARNAPAAAIDSRGAAAASAAMDKLSSQTGKAESAAERLTSAAREQGSILGSVVAANAERASTAVNGLALAAGAAGAATGITATSAALDTTVVKANAAAAAIGNMQTAAARAANGPQQFNPFGGVGVAAAAASKGFLQFGQAQKLTAYQSQQLSFQLNDLFVQMASGQSPITALIQQGSQLNGTFGGIGGTLGALRSLITPTTVAIGGAAAAVGGLAYAYTQGAAQSKAFNDAITLSGNYAGQTQGQVNTLVATVAESTKTSVGTVREFNNALISTGQIGPQAMALATDAIVRYGEATNKTANEAAADFIKMARDPAKFARELNQTWNAWTSTELDAIETMQKGDKAGEAQALVLQKMIEHLQGLNKNLGDVDRVGRSFSKMLGDLKDGFYAIGRDRTLEDRLQKLQGIFDRTDTSGFLNKINEALGVGAEKRQNFFAGGNAKEQQATLLAQQEKERKEAEEKAAKAERTKQSEAGGKVLKGYLDRAKPEELYKERKAELERSIAARRADGVKVTAEEEKAAFAQLKKDFAKPKGPANNEAAQVMREQLGDDLSAFKAALAAEKETLAFHQREMQGIYQAGGISLKAFFDDKRTSIADGVKAETAELDKEIARLEQYKAAIKDPSEKVRTQKQINQVGAEKAKLQTAAERDTKLVNQEEAASFKALNDQITNYNANLLQMQGDELGAARLRAQVTIDNARILAAQGAKDAAGNPVKVDVSALQQAIQTTNEFADVQRQAGLLAQNTARAEEAAYMVAELGGKSLAEQENAVYAVRSRALDQLGLLATKARELAEASTDPKIKQFAADLALQYAKAAEAVDPALNRLREAQRNLAAGITNTIDNGIANFGQNYTAQRKEARDELKAEKDKYDQKINILEGYLATSRDKNDQARLREKIKNLQAQKDSVKGESKGGSVLSTINKSILQPMAGQALATVNKLLITDPLNEYLKGQFKSLTEGNGAIAKSLKDALGIKDAKVDPKVLAEQAAATATDTLKNSLTAQTSAVDASTLALQALANAANSAAGVAGGGNSKPLTVEAGSKEVIPSMGDFTRADRALEASQNPAAAQATAEASKATDVFSSSAMAAAKDVSMLAAAAGKGGGALGMLPSIVNLFQAAVSAMNAGGAASGGSGGGGIFGSIAGLFGGGGSGAGAMATNSAGLAAGQGVSASALANLMEYGLAEGGLVKGPGTGTSDSIPAKLSNGEFVVPAKATSAFLPVLEAMRSGDSSASVLGGLLERLGVDNEKASALRVHGARELGGPVSAGKLYRVNEKRPELLNVGNKQFLMMGAQGGSVDPNPGARGQGGNVQHLSVTVAMPQGANAATAQQFGTIAGRQIQTSLRRNG